MRALPDENYHIQNRHIQKTAIFIALEVYKV